VKRVTTNIAVSVCYVQWFCRPICDGCHPPKARVHTVYTLYACFVQLQYIR